MDDYSKDALTDRLQIILDQLEERPEIEITYCQPDPKKHGGGYVTAVGTAKKVDEYTRIVVMADGVSIPIDEIVAIEGAIFETLNDQ